MKFLLELLRSDFLEEKEKKERKKIRSMNLYPRLCSSFLRRSSNNRCSLSSDLFVNLSGRRLETICYSYRPSLPRSAHAASRLVLFLLVESSSRPFEARFPPLSGNCPRAQNPLCPFRAASATCREYFRCSPANLTPFARVLANFPCPLFVRSVSAT